MVATLLQHADLAVLGSRFDGAQGREDDASSGESKPDVIVADYESGIDVVQARASVGPLTPSGTAPKVLIVTGRESESEIRHALEAGVHGYLLEGCSPEELVDGVRAVQRGMRHLDGLAGHRIAESLTHRALTSRETEVLRLIARGYPNKTISKRLNITVGTVKAHIKGILQKLNSASRTEATSIASRRGLLGSFAEQARADHPSDSWEQVSAARTACDRRVEQAAVMGQ
jgi:two-component system NarL family response regulator